MNDTEQILNQIRELLLSLNFKEVEIGGRTNYMLNNIYCVPQHINSLGFLIEYADSLEEAKKNWHEDGDCFPIVLGEKSILSGIKEELMKEIFRFDTDKKAFQSAV